MRIIRCRCLPLLLAFGVTLGPSCALERPERFPAYYPSAEEATAAEAALEAATQALAEGKLEDAAEGTREAARLIPTSAKPIVLRAVIAEQQGRTAEAVDLYREALAWDPAESRALAALDRLQAPRYGDVITQYEDQLVLLTNQSREAEGVAALKPHPALAEVARGHSEAMRDLDFFSHESPKRGCRTLLGRFLKRFEGNPARLGENLSRRYTRPDPALNEGNIARSHAELMASPGHRANILNSDFVYVGVGIAVNPESDYWITEVFMKPRAAKNAVAIMPK